MLSVDIQIPRDRFNVIIKSDLCRGDKSGITAVMGASGCGKTSFLRTLAGLEANIEGRIVFKGQCWLDTDNNIWVPPEQRRIGYIFQDARLFPHLDVAGNLAFSQRRANPDKTIVLEYDAVVAMLNIEHLLYRSIHKLSGGEKQRVAIARSLLNAPQLLLMDEPLASLDWESKQSILTHLKQIHRNTQIPTVIVSHSREEVAQIADYIIVMANGRIEEEGHTHHMLSNPDATLTRDYAALTVIDATVKQHDKAYGYSVLSFGAETILATQLNAKVGESLRVLIPAQDVSVSNTPLEYSSIQNQLLTTLIARVELNPYNWMLHLKTNGQTLLAIITKRAATQLNIQQGQQLYACFKAACLKVV